MGPTANENNVEEDSIYKFCTIVHIKILNIVLMQKQKSCGRLNSKIQELGIA